jgi:8-oxo-dGTP pyrophosphatase MutT (NUDIX family)
MRPIVVVACVLLNNFKEILMGLRADRLEWEVPGGKLDNERLVDGFNRELLEETGIQALGTPQLLGISEPDPSHFKGNRYMIHFMVIRDWKGFPRRLEPDKCLNWRWFSLDELPPLDKCTPGTRDFFTQILPHYLQEGEINIVIKQDEGI